MGLPDWVGDVARIASGGFILHKLGLPDAGDLLKGPPDAPPPEKIDKPPPPPDLTDEAVRQARIAARRRVLIGQGIGSTFLSGPLGDGTTPSTRAPSLAGY